jgi:hypothetical protein
VSALVTLGGAQALEAVDRDAMQGFLLRVAVPPEQGGGFVMHEGRHATGQASCCVPGRPSPLATPPCSQHSLPAQDRLLPAAASPARPPTRAVGGLAHRRAPGRRQHALNTWLALGTAGGERDVRACYCAMAVARHLKLDVPLLLERSGMVDYVRRCQVRWGG